MNERVVSTCHLALFSNLQFDHSNLQAFQPIWHTPVVALDFASSRDFQCRNLCIRSNPNC
eukprot:08129.XXX_468359_468538_1 [CDS] Oithona nana genome sequencing.